MGVVRLMVQKSQGQPPGMVQKNLVNNGRFQLPFPQLVQDLFHQQCVHIESFTAWKNGRG